MKKIAVVGSGKIGAMIADFLVNSGDFSVTVVDRSREQLEQLDTAAKVERSVVNVTSPVELMPALAGQFAVINAAPFHLTRHVAEAALAQGVHYLDLTEDVASTRHVKQISIGAQSAFIPQCGLAPGFVTIATQELMQRFDRLRDVSMRVGALPQFPSNALGYNLTWSTDGLINEYCEPCEAIVNGERRETKALEECERFALDGVAYEAFNTSGGLGSLCETLSGKVENLNYRTIRYPGHSALLKVLLHDLRLRDHRDVLKDIFERALPATFDDVVIVFVTVSGWKSGRLMQENYTARIYGQQIGDRRRSAIQITTAAGICGVLDLLAQGMLPSSGFVRQEDVDFKQFIGNRFGRWYAASSTAQAAA